MSAKGEAATFNLTIGNAGDWGNLLTDIHAVLQKHREAAPEMTTKDWDAVNEFPLSYHYGEAPLFTVDPC